MIWWIGQSGYIMKIPNGKVLIIDAYLSGGDRRMMPPPIDPKEIECDYYICTHNHLDHADLETIKKIPIGQAKTFIGPRNVVKSLEKLGIQKESIREVNVGDCIDLDGIRLRDTGFHDFLFYLSKYTIDIMLVCINGGMGNMGIDEAVKLTRLLRPRVVVPNHYGMFEANTADPTLFRTRLMATGAEPSCQILKVGEKYLYPAKEL